MSDAARPQNIAQFTQGSTFRHVAVMSATGWAGLAAIFVVDFLNLFYISLLKKTELTAAIGFGSSLIFALMSFGIGTVIAGTALTARAVGAQKRDEARQIAASSLVFSVVMQAVPAVLMAVFAHQILALMGATGETLEIAAGFLHIVLPAMPLMGLGMMLSGVLRAVADARRSMNVTLIGALTTAILDPIFIFGFDLGVTGAAIVTVISRFAFVAVGVSGAIGVHDMVARPTLARFMKDAKALLGIGVPAILTNLATPVGSIYTTAIVARFGEAAIAGGAVLDRLVPLAFGGVFALSGAIGPIIGQNYGAREFGRLNRAVTDSVTIIVVYCTVVWAILALFAEPIANVFHVVGPGREILLFFCHWSSGTFVFTGLMFVANSVFNNLGFAMLSTAFNWGRATLGTIPFVLIGATYYGPVGVNAGWAIGAIFFGLGSLWSCYRVLDKVKARALARDAAERAARQETAPAN